MLLKKFLAYLNPATLFNRKDKPDLNLRFMHGINRISILMFLVCLIVILVRYFTK